MVLPCFRGVLITQSRALYSLVRLDMLYFLLSRFDIVYFLLSRLDIVYYFLAVPF